MDDEAPNKMLSSALIPGFDWEFDADEVFLKIKFFLFYLITTIALRSHT